MPNVSPIGIANGTACGIRADREIDMPAPSTIDSGGNINARVNAMVKAKDHTIVRTMALLSSAVMRETLSAHMAITWRMAV